MLRVACVEGSLIVELPFDTRHSCFGADSRCGATGLKQGASGAVSEVLPLLLWSEPIFYCYSLFSWQLLLVPLRLGVLV